MDVFTSAILGLGYGQAFAAFCVVTYYCSLMGLTLYYLVASFQSELPWSYCREEWKDCIDTVSKDNNLDRSAGLLTTYNGTLRSSAELYFRYVFIFWSSIRILILQKLTISRLKKFLSTNNNYLNIRSLIIINNNILNLTKWQNQFHDIIK